ncbi:endonuclease/exonuclease/phosphatase family protein [Saccharopolyspora sp. WRP15-2]|uniref:Endonuclease/exonuclease/phosphatase family protein n=1 Tax=Saccharopolyspora oryzae TaxID=2997343 RepID=A0ABT4V5T2_9PSEU|nr:endonuclease/exonuclease/phosphatase family protein [Saccharopolyspora oryzae]MDA3628667.1 endonuclease/exonuclease/phosphatase family protein [Saccharopolyspora oryzae]
MKRAALVAAAVAVGLVTPTANAAEPVRFATFNASLNRSAEGELLADLSTPDDPQAQEVAEVVQRTRPDVLLLNEFDYVEGGAAVGAFRTNYLARGQHGADPIDYPYAYTAPVNTGVPSGMDLDNDGAVGGPGDAHGFGAFPGQYGMVVLSKYPIGPARTFQQFRWADMPGARLPDDPATPEPADWFSPEELEQVRLSSKSHWDLPIDVDGRTVHFLTSHPTPPAFDGPEKRNVLRNQDEIRFWADYVTPKRGDYIYDDQGIRGGLAPGSQFVVAGDQNSDPLDGDSNGIRQLLQAPRVIDPRPGSAGAVEASGTQGGANENHRGDPFLDTGDFNDESPGNLRIDYVLPSAPLVPLRAEVFWPTSDDELSRLNDASDHHLVWLDVVP